MIGVSIEITAVLASTDGVTIGVSVGVSVEARVVVMGELEETTVISATV